VTIVIDNKAARRLFLHRHGLADNPAAICDKGDIQALIENIGFVQVDSIRTVERAHHLILFSRKQTYKRQMLEELLEKDRSLFENWTHDASIIPSRFYPYWKHRFDRESGAIVKRWEKWGRRGFTQISGDVIDHIRQNGPTFSRELKPDEPGKKTPPGWWDWHAPKASLEYLWRTGETAICHRKNFQKAYDLSERVIPPQHRENEVSGDQFIDWACSSALQRLGFATHGEIAAFWDLISPAQAKNWAEQPAAHLIQAEIRSFDNKSTKLVWAARDIADAIKSAPDAPARLRILSPFDPMLRDRNRAEFLFGFRFRVEMFVPEKQREYGYYVFPILQGDRLIGRIDMKAERKSAALNVRRIWLQPKIKWSKARKAALDSELARIARFTALDHINFDRDAFGDG